MNTILITHSTEQNFLDLFRADLASCNESVIILSPFLSYNRAANYYPVLSSLKIRNISIEIYAKPKNEQPFGLQAKFDEVEKELKKIGVSFFTRPGMHEKVGVIDSKILWHGSLNIFSHNDTKESMLRFESEDLAKEVLADLKIKSIANINDVASDNKANSVNALQENVSCPECQRAMIFFENANLWLCSNSPSCSGMSEAANKNLDSSDSDKKQPFSLNCPVCNALMKIHRSVFLKISCTNEDCGFSFDPRISASLLRVMRRGTKK